MAFGFAHHGNQNIQRLYCGFAGRLGMYHRPLDDALEAQCRLGFDRIQKMIGNLRRIFGHAGGQLLGQDFQIRTTQFQDVRHSRIFFYQHQKQVFQADKLITRVACFTVEQLQDVFQFG